MSYEAVHISMRYWYHSAEKNSVGKIAARRLQALIDSDAVDADVLIWREGMDAWRPAHEVLDLEAPSSALTRGVSPIERPAGSSAVEGRTQPQEPLAEDGWLFLDEDVQRGPLRANTIQEMLDAGALSSDVLLWSSGFTEWMPASQIDAFNGRASSTPHPTASSSVPEIQTRRNVLRHPPADNVEISQTRPWVRYFARSVDGLLVAFSVGVIAALVYPPLLELGDLLIGILTLFLFVFVEPFLLSNWGTTPGKSLFQTSVLRKEGGFLSYATALRRSGAVWLKGLGAGIPVVSLFTMGLAYSNLRDDGTTSWDETVGSVVVHRKVGPVRIVVFIVFMLVVATLMVLSQ